MLARFASSIRSLPALVFRFHVALSIASVLTAAIAVHLLTSIPTAAYGQNGGLKPGMQAPALPIGGDWLNTDKPISLDDLKGRVVVLDFWTFCCINCIHTLPDLAKLEARYPGVLVVIGIHTPKFENEKKTENIKKAIMRYEVKHPVLNDADLKTWKRYGVSTWPTLVLIDPEGNLVGSYSGEGGYKIFDAAIAKLVKDHKAKGTLKLAPLHFQLEKERRASPLNFPGKVLADAASRRLFIADSTNHRIVVTTLDGKKIAVAGCGIEGKKDGKFAEARFSDPQGMTLDGDILYVADRKNHSLRALNLKDETVKTVAGTGEQERDSRKKGPALKTGLNSPWDVLLLKKRVYIAMAGHHQIWTYDPVLHRVDPYAGDSVENLKDGPLMLSRFAQPSGLASDGKHLFVADAEISAIRSVPLPGVKEYVSTVVGEGLFEFGDQNGRGNQVRLQHALGVVYHEGKLYVADTYNSKIKIIDPVLRTCDTFLGESEKHFYEPGGLSIADGKMYVADTNNHRIQVVDMKTKTVSTLRLQDVEPVLRDAVVGAATK